MINININFFTILLIIIILSLTYGSKVDKCDINLMDNCAQKLFIYGDLNFTFPDNLDLLKINCKTRKESEICIKRFGQKCVKPFARQYINIMLRGPTRNLKNICSSKKSLNLFLRNLQCLNSSKAGMDKCHEDIITNMLQIEKARKQDWIPLTCCYLSKLGICSHNVIDQHCKTDEEKTYLGTMIKDLRGDSFDLFCNTDLEYGSNKCDSMINKIPKEKSAKELTEATRRPFSVIPIVLNLMDRYISRS